MGYGASVLDAIREARHDWIALCDADGTYPIERIEDLLCQASDDVPHVMGQRTIRESVVRSVFRGLYFTLVRFVAGVWIPDVNSGFQLMRTDLALEHSAHLPKGFSCTTTLPLLTLLSGRRIAHVPISFRPRLGCAKLRVVRDGLGAVRTVLRIFWMKRPGKLILSILLLMMCFGAASYAISSFFREPR
jgi:hypothetical protein